jgi:hypothetical protein
MILRRRKRAEIPKMPANRPLSARAVRADATGAGRRGSSFAKSLGILFAKQAETVTVPNFHRATPRFSAACGIRRLANTRFPGKRPICSLFKVLFGPKAPLSQQLGRLLSAETLNFARARPLFRQNASFASCKRASLAAKAPSRVSSRTHPGMRPVKTRSFAGLVQKRTFLPASGGPSAPSPCYFSSLDGRPLAASYSRRPCRNFSSVRAISGR